MGRKAGYKHTEETKAKMREAKLGKSLPPEQRKSIGVGRRRSLSELTPEERREKYGKAWTGRRHTEESKAKMRASHAGKPLSEAHKAAIASGLEETRRKAAEAAERHRADRIAMLKDMAEAIQEKK